MTRRRSSKEKYLCPVLVLLLGQSLYKCDNLVLLLLYLELVLELVDAADGGDEDDEVTPALVLRDPGQ